MGALGTLEHTEAWAKRWHVKDRTQGMPWTTMAETTITQYTAQIKQNKQTKLKKMINVYNLTIEKCFQIPHF